MKLFKVTLAVVALLSVFSFLGTLFYVSHLADEIPSELVAANTLKSGASAYASEVFDRQGRKIGEFADQRRYHVPINNIPEHVTRAFVAIEDKNFYSHVGIDVVAIIRAFLSNVRGRGIRQGGSTITQQLVRLYFFDRKQTLQRKIKEALLAVAVEKRLSKDEILERYLNKIYFGNRSYGIEAAARNYFRKSSTELTLGESALLAGLPKAPSRLNPTRYPERARSRAKLVLRRMAEDEYISRREAAHWMKRKIEVASRPEDFSARAPYFLAAVKQEINRKFEHNHLSLEGLKIYTTLDLDLQQGAGERLVSGLGKAAGNDAEGALLSMDPRTGAVLAMQGGKAFKKSQFNRTKLTRRALGGMFMPVYIAHALERGYTLASKVDAEAMNARSTSSGRGPTLYEAAIEGRIYEAARLFTSLGLGSIMDFSVKMGLKFDRQDFSLAVGYGEASPIELAGVYSVFANGGYRVVPHLISRIETSAGRVIYRHRYNKGVRVISQETAYIVNALLQHIVKYNPLYQQDGTGIAAMSSSTDDLHNSWTVAYRPHILTGIWIGSEHGKVRLDTTESAVASLSWNTMKSLNQLPEYRVSPGEDFAVPSTISFARFPKKFAGAMRTVPFTIGSEPLRL